MEFMSNTDGDILNSDNPIKLKNKDVKNMEKILVEV